MLARNAFGVCVMLSVVATAHGQSFPYEATVSTPEVEARALPSNHENAYPTTKIRQGTAVTVVGEKAGGWLAIKPPPGSYSWVQAKHVRAEQPPYAIVEEDDAEVRLGSSLVNRPPMVRQIKLKRGEKVVLVKDQKPQEENGVSWVMIHPPANEERYIPRDAVRPSQVATAEPPTGAPIFAPTSGAAPVVQGTTGNSDPLWAEAERAEREGRLLDAERAYSQLAKQTQDNDLRILCHNRIHMIHQSNRRGTAAYPPATNANQRLVPNTVSRPLTGATSQYTYAPESRPPAAAAGNPTGNQTRGPGLLVRSNVPVAGQQGYLLDLGKGQPVCYVIAQPGVNLEAMVGRQVIVAGPVDYHTGYRQNVMRAVQVTPQ
jgi:hypothetical protein